MENDPLRVTEKLWKILGKNCGNPVEVSE